MSAGLDLFRNASTHMLISDEYRQIQRDLHVNDPDYGGAANFYAPMVADIVNHFKPGEILDYGAGKGRLGKALRELVPFPVTMRQYEPAVPEWAAPPSPCGFVACIDVLEHIEPDCLDDVLDDLARVTANLGVFTVHTGPALKVLPDGRNAHLTQQPAKWWVPKLLERFDLVSFQRNDNGFWLLVEGPDAVSPLTL